MTQEQFDKRDSKIAVSYKGKYYMTGNNGHGLVDLHNILTRAFVINVRIEDINKLETKPPIGLKPKLIHDEERFNDVQAAIMRYLWDNRKILVEWITEYNDLITEKI